MIRTIIVPDASDYNLKLDFPMDYLGEEVEVIAFKKQEGLLEAKKYPKKFASFDTIKIDTTDFTFNRDYANER